MCTCVSVICHSPGFTSRRSTRRTSHPLLHPAQQTEAQHHVLRSTSPQRLDPLLPASHHQLARHRAQHLRLHVGGDESPGSGKTKAASSLSVITRHLPHKRVRQHLQQLPRALVIRRSILALLRQLCRIVNKLLDPLVLRRRLLLRVSGRPSRIISRFTEPASVSTTIDTVFLSCSSSR